MTGDAADLAALADDLAGRPLVAHDVKDLGGGRHGLLANGRRASRSTTTR